MPKTRSLAQQRKRRVRMSKASPFPVPVATISGDSPSSSHWLYYRAVLQDGCVTVKHTGDMDFLYRMGFFGKGQMSRGQPQWSEHWRVVALPVRSSQDEGRQSIAHARVTSRRRYMNHLKWKLQSSEDEAGLGRIERDGEYTVTERSQGEAHLVDKAGWDTCTQRGSAGEPNPSTTGGEVQDVVGADSKNSELQEDWGEEEGDADFWGEESTTKPVSDCAADPSAASWDSSAPGDADFWGAEGTSSAPEICAEHAASCDTGKDDGKNLKLKTGNYSQSSSTPRVADDDRQSGDERMFDKESAATEDSGQADQLMASHSMDLSSSDDLIGDQKGTLLSGSNEAGKTVRGQDTDDDGVKRHGHDEAAHYAESENTPLDSSHAQDPDNTTKTGVCGCQGKTEDGTSIKTPGSFHKNCSNIDGTSSTNCDNRTKDGVGVCPELARQWSEFCEESDVVSGPPDQNFFVVPDSDEEELTPGGLVCRSRTRWRPVVKADPYPVQENLQLSFEEAFFLSYGLGCLSVCNSQETPLGLVALWQEFIRRQPSFLPHYVAYHHYRSHNWVPKTGLKFGCTFLLYKDGPAFFHGSYSVVVKFVDGDGRPVRGYEDQRQFTWTSLAGLKRITEHVGKELVICYVVKPKDLSSEAMMSPQCIPSFQVKEMLVSRWVSSQEREGKALEDIP